jgi:PrtD family type I secretion system ABC transporter
MPRGSSQQSLYQLGEIRRLLTSNVLPSLFDIPVMVIFTAIVFAINTILGIIVLCGMVILFLTALLSEVLTSRLVKDSEESGAAARKSLTVQFAQQELVRALGMYPQVINRWGKLQGTHLQQLVSLLGRTAALSATSKVTRQLIQIAIIGGGALLVIEADLNAGIIFATSVIASRALAPIEHVVGGWRSLKQGRLALQKLNDRIDSYKLTDTVTPLPRPSRALQAERVIFQPAPGAQPILKGITGGFTPGQAVAIVGPSGAGKSTFARMLVGYLEPTSGQVSLDGQDLRAWDPVSRGSYMGYMPQNVTLFDGTIRENIARMRSDDDPQLAIEAAQFVGIHDLIMRFPNGYDSVISEGGFQPSGGQRQLLGLARAFYGGPAFVVLDEPNASLDGDGENILFNTIKRARAARIGTIIVTQRLSLLHHVDKVLVLKNGQVEAYGPPSEVIPANVRAVPNKATSS